MTFANRGGLLGLVLSPPDHHYSLGFSRPSGRDSVPWSRFSFRSL
jgi:hypothetical protein